jgi:acetyl-CoA carboxylase/biotin carboxylase 1
MRPEDRFRSLKNELQTLASSVDLSDDQLGLRVQDLLTRSPNPLDVLHGVFPELLTASPRVTAAVVHQYISLLIGSLPFESYKAILSERAPRLSFQWVMAPFDVNDQGLPESSFKLPSSLNASSSGTGSRSLRASPDSPAAAAALAAASGSKSGGLGAGLDVPARELRSQTGPSAARHSLACVFNTTQELREALPDVVSKYEAPSDATTRNILMLIILDASDVAPARSRSRSASASQIDPFVADDPSIDGNDATAAVLKEMLAPHVQTLIAHRIVRVTVILGRFPHTPFFHSFRMRLGYAEDVLYRNLVPELAFLLELRRLDRYDLARLPTNSARVLVYSGVERLPEGSTRPPASREQRLFVRAFVNKGNYLASGSQLAYLDWSMSAFKDFLEKNHVTVETAMKQLGSPDEGKRMLALLREVETVFVECVNALEYTISNSNTSPAVSNSLFIAIMSPLHIHVRIVEQSIPFIMSRFAERLFALNVHVLELVINRPRTIEGGVQDTHRFLVTNYSGGLWRTYSGTEQRSLSMGVPSPRVQLKMSRQETALSSEAQYVPNARVSRRRYQCRLLGTTYVYDLLDVLERALISAWSLHRKHHGAAKLSFDDDSAPLIDALEYRLDANDVAKPVLDPGPVGDNNVGMVAWKLTIRTPEYPNGRDLVLIANDVSHEGGSFGPREDALYKQASAYARQLGIPRIYVSANAGARIGLADELMEHFQVAFKEEDPTKGFDYLYLSPEKAAKFASSVKTRPVAGNPDRMEITDIIGAQHGIGVENLQGSGLIAGETSLAYRETFTLTIVTGRSVGIGAYVTRLGQRVIQNQGPILLTGYDALNRLLSREVYVSNTQLGGPNIMYRNGVSHVDVTSDLDAFKSMLRWLSFVPASRGAPLPIMTTSSDMLADPLNRPVEWRPDPNLAYDPRMLLDGQTTADGRWISGFFDRGTFVETLGGWARTVVVGRARLGGIPCGVIAVETRTVQKVIPADPASENSREEIVQQAGQVWYPDSAFKTAQAVFDFVGEELPLFIFANWRGFSGGVADMFNEVLKYGSMIVDALSVYKRPVFVYLPPFAELRGGSWAVIDPFINAHGLIEMYTSESAQGGILESAGTVAIKFRKREQLALMCRTDPVVSQLSVRRKELETKLRKGGDATARSELDVVVKQLEERVEALSKVYHTIALRFCELHDTPGRMLEKKVVSGIVPWRDSRKFFGDRLAQRLQECMKAEESERSAAAHIEVVARAINSGNEEAAKKLLSSLDDKAKNALKKLLG